MQTMVGTILQRLRESKEEQVVKLQVYPQQTEATNANRLATRTNHKADFQEGLMLKKKGLAFKCSPPISWSPLALEGHFQKSWHHLKE
jgi:hypothetical protein